MKRLVAIFSVLGTGANLCMLTRNRILLAALLAASPVLALAQQNQRIWRIGCLSVTSLAANPHLMDAFSRGLRELGYIEGRNVVFDCRSGERGSPQLDQLAVDLLNSKSDLILAWTTSSVRSAKRASSTIPIVMVSVTDPVGQALIASLARPGGNVTGVVNLDADSSAKRIQLLKEVLPGLSRMATLRNPTSAIAVLQSKDAQNAAKVLGIDLQIFDASNPNEFENTFNAMKKARIGAVTVQTDPIFLTDRKLLAALAIQGRIPSIFARDENVDAGGLLSYGATLSEQFHHAAAYADKIFRGAKPSELPVEQPTKVDLVINMKTAKTLGVGIPQSVLVRADRVIE